MKIKAFYLSAVAAIVTGLVSCDNAELKYDDVTGPGRLFLNEAVGTAKSVSFVIPDDGSVYTVTPRISKPLGRDLKLTVYVDEKALDEYNKQNNTSYTLLPNTNYEFESSAVIPAGKVVSNPVTITLHPLTTEQNKTGFVHALPIAVKAEGEAMQVLEGADAFVLAATPVPYSNVVEITGNSYLQTRFAEITNSRRGPSKRCSTPVRSTPATRRHGSRRPSATTSRAARRSFRTASCSVWATAAAARRTA